MSDRGLLLPDGTGGHRILIKGESTVVAKQFEMLEKNGTPCYWWAENGLIKWEHEGVAVHRVRGSRPTRGVLMWEDVANRVLSLSEMISKSGDDDDYVDERLKQQRFICEMEKVLRVAQEQGSPIQRGLIAKVPEARKVKLEPVEVDFF